MTKTLRQLAVTGMLIPAAFCGCVTEPVARSERPPAEVGGRLSIGGFELLKPAEHLRVYGDAQRLRASCFGSVAGSSIEPSGRES